MNRSSAVLVMCAILALGACDGEQPPSDGPVQAQLGETFDVRSESIEASIDANGVARPFAEATLSTKLMGSVLTVQVREGDAVSAGQVLLTIDARDLTAKNAQVGASLSGAEAMYREAEINVQRMRTLYREDAAPKVQLDAAETGFARADAAVQAARAAVAELSAVRAYAVVRAPFSGTVTRRYVDAGAFAAPGAPLLTVQDTRRLRVTVTAAPEVVRSIARGANVTALIEGVPALARVEGVVPGVGSLYTVNAIVDNSEDRFLAGSAASIALPLGMRAAILVPRSFVRQQGDLTTVTVTDGKVAVLRYIRTGRAVGDLIEVLSGLRVGERIIIPGGLAGAN